MTLCLLLFPRSVALFVFTVVSLLCDIVFTVVSLLVALFVFTVVSSLCDIVCVYCCFLALWHCVYCCFLALWHCFCLLLFPRSVALFVSTVVYCRLHFSRQVFLDLIEEVDAIIDKSVC